MILADTSAWVEYDRSTRSAVDRRVVDLVQSGEQLVTTEPVVMELTAGARTAAAAEKLRRLVLRGGLLPFETPTDFDAAVAIYRTAREAGFTPRGMVDCMIAAVAQRHAATVLCRDVDLERICDVVGIELDDASTARS